ncbi:MAG: formylglycine-generating enzyme family protein [Planctomycetota bacterium]|jgi:hypothetical protein
MKTSVSRGPVIIGLVVLAAFCNCTFAACPSADLNGDCFVDFNDLAILAADWPVTDYDDLALMAAQWLAPDPRVPNDMVFIPAGTFQMGDNLGDGLSDELPVHMVTLDSFYMGTCEVTSGQYCDYLNSALAQGLITVTDGIVYKGDSGTSYPYCHTSSTSSSHSQIAYSGGVFSARMKNGRDMSKDPNGLRELVWGSCLLQLAKPARGQKAVLQSLNLEL